jgi:hypothetical protein
MKPTPILPVALAAFFLGVSLPAKTWTLADAALDVRFDDQTGLLAVTQKSSGRVWQQLPAEASYKVGEVRQSAGQLEIALQGSPDLRVTLELTKESDLAITIAAAADQPIKSLAWPGPFATPGDDWQLVLPLSEGSLIPVREADAALGPRRTYAIYNMSGLIMPWLGVTDAGLAAGYSLTIDTPFDAALRLGDRDGRPVIEPVWQGELGRFGYTRKLRCHFFDAGGYVTQAKPYRDYVRRNEEFSTLRERAKTRPHIDNLIGAVHIYTWDDGRNLELARELKAAGIERAWIGWDPSHPPYPAKGYDEGLKALGYLSGVYDLYRDCYDDVEFDKKAATNETLRSLWLHRYPYHGLFQQIVARDADGSPRELMMSGDVGIMRYWVCTKAILPHIGERIGRELQTYPHDSIFLDVTLAAGPIDCLSPEHRMTHREDVAARLAIHKYMANDLKMVVGSEWGAGYGVAHTEFMHGNVTMSQFWGSETFDRNSPYYTGSWRNTVRPDIMLKDAKASPTYLKYGLGPEYRIPLFELVYHDCTVSSWRWDDNSHKQAETWARKDLFTALYGVAPQWNLDRGLWDTHRDRFVSSYQAVAPVLRAIGYEEMTGHRFLNADRTLQETAFASGHKVIANFAAKPQTAADREIPAGGFVLIAP